MIKTFLRERLSWILLFLFMQLFSLFIAYIDSAVPFLPILYSVFLSMLIFSFFLITRYHKETKFYRNFLEWENGLDITTITNANSPFEEIIEEGITSLAEKQKQLLSENLLLLEQEKDELLSWIHEVKTPLTTLHLIIDRIEDEKIKAQLAHEWLRIHLLLDQQLHQKRIPFIENDLYIEKLELKPLIFKEIKTLQSWCIQKGIGFDIELEENVIYSDGKWLAFMLRQILSNAIKYSEASTILIKSEKQEEKTRIMIKDFGRGIDPKDLPRIFEKGFTSTTKHQDAAATGMGLYLTQKIAKALLIHIEVLSELQQGTTFILTLPKRNEFVSITGM